MLTYSGVSSFCPMMHTTLSPFFTNLLSTAYLIASLIKLSLPIKEGILSVTTPLVTLSCLIILMDIHRARTGCLGLYLATNLAVTPLSVIAMIKLALRSFAARTAVLHKAS